MIKKISVIAILLFAGVGGYLYSGNPKISVVMSTYNRADMVKVAIESILNQTMSDFEFIIINDGSSDDTDRILKEYARKDSRIRIITNKENKGFVYSLNRGFDEAKGKYIARMDDDDISLPTRFEKQYDFMEKNQDIALVSTWVGNPKNYGLWPFHQETDPEKNKMLLYLNRVPVSHPASFIRKSFLNDNNIRYNPNYKAAEDRKFYLDITDAQGKISSIPEVLLLYRFHQENPDEYYVSQTQSAHKFFHDDILPRLGNVEEFEGLKDCAYFRKLSEKNQKLNLISQPKLEAFIKENCLPIDAEQVNHTGWSDHFVFEDKKVCRYKVRDCATVEKKTKDILTVKWDRWGRETFRKKGDIWTLEK